MLSVVHRLPVDGLVLTRQGLFRRNILVLENVMPVKGHSAVIGHHSRYIWYFLIPPRFVEQGPSSSHKQGGSAAAMDYSVADAITAMGGDAATGRTDGDISAILPFGIAPGAKLVMRREKMAAEQVWMILLYHIKS